MHDLKRSKKKMYKKQMPAMINSYNEESTVEIEDLERGCKNKTNINNSNNACNCAGNQSTNQNNTTIKNTTVITIIMNTMTMMNLNAFVNVKNQTTTVNLVKLNQILV